MMPLMRLRLRFALAAVAAPRAAWGRAGRVVGRRCGTGARGGGHCRRASGTEHRAGAQHQRPRRRALGAGDGDGSLRQEPPTARIPPASLSKLATVYATFRALEKEGYSGDDTFLVSEKAWRTGGSKMFVEVGKRVRIDDLLRGVIVSSGNDASIVLAEGLGGGRSRVRAKPQPPCRRDRPCATRASPTPPACRTPRTG